MDNTEKTVEDVISQVTAQAQAQNQGEKKDAQRHKRCREHLYNKCLKLRSAHIKYLLNQYRTIFRKSF